MSAVNLSIELTLMVALGIFVGRSGIVQAGFSKQLTSLVMKVLLPCMIVKSMMGSFSWEVIRNCVHLVVLALVVLALTAGLGQIAYRITGRSTTGRILRFSIMFTNFTFVGIPVLQALYGDTSVFYFVVFLIPYRMVYYSSSEFLLSPPGHKPKARSLGEKIKGWLSPPLVAVFVGLFFYLTQIKLPAPISGVVSSLGSCASPMGMLLCGLSLSQYPFRKLFQPRFLLYPLIRNLVLPALFLVLVLAIGLERELAQVIVIFGALPTASLLAAYTIQYDPSPEAQFEAAAAVLFSVIFAALTLPMWAWLLNLLIP